MNSVLFIGRFQPFHNGHLDAIKQILDTNDHLYIGIGSTAENYQPANPLTAGERYQLIKETLIVEGIDRSRFDIIPVPNIDNFAIWPNHVLNFIPDFNCVYTGSTIVKRLFEDIDFKVEIVSKNIDLCASDLREMIINGEEWQDKVPNSVYKLLQKWDFSNRLKDITV